MKRGYIYAGLIGTLLALLWVVRGCRDRQVDKAIAAPTLQADDKTKTIFDQKRHIVTRVERNADGSEKVTKSFLNSHGPVAIVEKKDGRTVLIQRTWGTEVGPFVGAALGSD